MTRDGPAKCANAFKRASCCRSQRSSRGRMCGLPQGETIYVHTSRSMAANETTSVEQSSRTRGARSSFFVMRRGRRPQLSQPDSVEPTCHSRMALASTGRWQGRTNEPATITKEQTKRDGDSGGTSWIQADARLPCMEQHTSSVRLTPISRAPWVSAIAWLSLGCATASVAVPAFSGHRKSPPADVQTPASQNSTTQWQRDKCSRQPWNRTRREARRARQHRMDAGQSLAP